jgi:hypothetical protein
MVTTFPPKGNSPDKPCIDDVVTLFVTAGEEDNPCVAAPEGATSVLGTSIPETCEGLKSEDPDGRVGTALSPPDVNAASTL